MIPEGLKDQIELIVERWRDNDMDDEDLVTALCLFVEHDRGQKRRRPTTPEEREVALRKKHIYIAKIRANPVLLEQRRVKARAALKKRREADPERARAHWRATDQRRKDRDPEAYREAVRRKSALRHLRNGPSQVAKARRHALRRLKEETRTKKVEAVRDAAKKAVPAGFPANVRDDIVAAVVVVFMDGRIILDEVKAEVKRQTTAYNRMFDTFKTKSLDAIVPGTDSLRLIDTIASDRGLA